jgi:hypothetical protein
MAKKIRISENQLQELLKSANEQRDEMTLSGDETQVYGTTTEEEEDVKDEEMKKEEKINESKKILINKFKRLI